MVTLEDAITTSSQFDYLCMRVCRRVLCPEGVAGLRLRTICSNTANMPHPLREDVCTRRILGPARINAQSSMSVGLLMVLISCIHHLTELL